MWTREAPWRLNGLDCLDSHTVYLLIMASVLALLLSAVYLLVRYMPRPVPPL